MEALHQIRMARNAVSHGRGNVTAGEACGLLRSAYILAVWFMKYYDRTFSADGFSLPKQGDKISDRSAPVREDLPSRKPPVEPPYRRQESFRQPQLPTPQTDKRVPVLAILLFLSLLLNLCQWFLLFCR